MDDLNYERDMSNSYVVFKVFREQLEEHAIKMLKYNKIPCLLQLSEKTEDSYTYLYYNITGKVSLFEWARQNAIEYQLLKQITESLLELVLVTQEYFLTEGCFIVHQKAIFIDLETKNCNFLYVPYAISPFNLMKQTQMLINDLFPLIHKQDEKAISLIHKLRMVMEDENFGILSFQKIIEFEESMSAEKSHLLRHEDISNQDSEDFSRVKIINAKKINQRQKNAKEKNERKINHARKLNHKEINVKEINVKESTKREQNVKEINQRVHNVKEVTQKDNDAKRINLEQSPKERVAKRINLENITSKKTGLNKTNPQNTTFKERSPRRDSIITFILMQIILMIALGLSVANWLLKEENGSLLVIKLMLTLSVLGVFELLLISKVLHSDHIHEQQLKEDQGQGYQQQEDEVKEGWHQDSKVGKGPKSFPWAEKKLNPVDPPNQTSQGKWGWDNHKTERLKRDNTGTTKRAFWVDEEGIKVPIIKIPFVIGKLKEAVDLTIQDDSVSKVHCKVIQEDGLYYLMDLNSQNGTHLNQKQIIPETSVLIYDGDQINIGNEKFTFKLY